VDLPFDTAGTLMNVSGEDNGGFLGGSGNYRKTEFEGRFYAPLGGIGGNAQFGGGIRFVLGLTAKSGFIFGDAGPFFTELYSMGGTQYGIPLRGYDEFSITPNGFDPSANGNTAASVASFGRSYAEFTAEIGARMSQMLYVNAFLDAGNVYRTPRQYDPTRLFRGAGFGVALVSPLGPMGIDIAYGFDRVDTFNRPKPGWKVHFKLGNFF
jgi:outer membrane protein insertion porin family